ncbi:MAG TPA: TolC family protein [Gammaproteobacteria bacterium]
MRYLKWLMTGLMAGSLAGCATYHARALPTVPDTRTRVPAPRIRVESLHLPGLAPHPFDASHGLDTTDVAILAVLNDPALKTLRAREHASAAQAFAAGLLPGPQLAYSVDRPAGDTAGLVTGHSVGLSYDLNALVASHYEKNVARATAQQADLDILWAEWQTAQQARLLFVQVVHDRQKLALLKQLRQALDSRYQNLRRALQDGDIGYDVLGLELAAVQDVDGRVRGIETDLSDAQFSLNALLGLAPDVHLDLIAGSGNNSSPSDQEIDTALKALPERRPDLIGLQYAYRSADEQVRQAVLAQFPAINLGINRANDTSNVKTNGFSIGLTFPFIAGGPASVHAAETGRDAVWQEYQARLDAAVSDVHSVAADLKLVSAQLARIQTSLPESANSVHAAGMAYARGDLTATDYYNLAITALNSQLQAVDLAAEQQQLQIALSTQLGLPPADLEHLALKEPSK